jgi:hypothetical protein
VFEMPPIKQGHRPCVLVGGMSVSGVRSSGYGKQRRD